jgi:hypothetical protein
VSARVYVGCCAVAGAENAQSSRAMVAGFMFS